MGSKLKLEEMNIGEVLEVLLDDGESIVNVPRSAKDDGHKILEIEQIEGHFKSYQKRLSEKVIEPLEV